MDLPTTESPLTELEQKLHALCTQVVEDSALELYDLEYRGSTGLLRVIIRNPKTDTASIEDCVQIDRSLSPYIERKEWMPQKLVLEVSSPGLDRPLRSRKQLLDSIGKRIAVKLNQEYQVPSKHQKALQHCHRQYRLNGVLQGVGESSLCIDVAGIKIDLPIANIKHACRELEF